MCKLRLISEKGKNGSIKDYIVDLENIDINVIDRPAYCTYNQGDRGYTNLTFKYSNINEELQNSSFNNDSILITFGALSGCIYSFSYKRNVVNNQLLKSLPSQIHSINETTRFKNNVSGFIKMIIKIIPKLDFN